MTVEAFIDASSQIIAAGLVNVKATDNSYIISISGGMAVGSGTSTIGAAVSYCLISNDIEAYVDDSTVDANDGDLTVEATSEPILASLAAGGADGGDLAIGGSIAINDIANSIEAYVESSTIFSSGNTTVEATESAVEVALAGGVGLTADEDEVDETAVGAAIAYNYVGNQVNTYNPDVADHDSGNNSSCLAYIDSSTVNVDGSLTVAAGYSPPDTYPSTTISSFTGVGDTIDLSIPLTKVDNQLAAIALGGSDAEQFGLGGFVSLSFIRETINAYISNCTTVMVDGAVSISSLDSSNIGTFAGSVTISQNSGAIGAAVASADIANTVASSISGSNVTSTTSTVGLYSEEKATEVNLAVGGTDASTFGLGGSVAVNIIDNTTTADVTDGADVQGDKGVTVSAKDDSSIGTGVGQVDISTGASGAGAGAAVAVDVIDNMTRAYVDASTVASSAGGVAVQATSDLDAVAVAFEGAGAKSYALGGAVIVNYVGDTTDAYVDGSSVTADSGVSVIASDTSTLDNGAGNVDIAIGSATTGSAALGAAVSINYITNTVDATIDDADVTSSGDVDVTANSDETIVAITAGLGGVSSSTVGQFSIGAEGSGSGNWVYDSTEALIEGHSDVQATGTASVNVTAYDNSSITAGAGVVALSFSSANQGLSLAVGISAATNYIGSASDPNTVEAAIEGSLVEGADGVSVSATGEPNITSVTVAGTLDTSQNVSAGGAGAGSGNTIYQAVEALINAGSVVITSVAGAAVSLISKDDSNILADAGGLSLGYSGGAAGGSAQTGAAAATNDLGSSGSPNQTVASIAGSTVTSGGGVSLTAESGDASTEQISAEAWGIAGSLTTGSGGGVSYAGAGSGSGNEIHENIAATVDDNSDITTNSDGSVALTATDNAYIKAGTARRPGPVDRGSNGNRCVGRRFANGQQDHQHGHRLDLRLDGHGRGGCDSGSPGNRRGQDGCRGRHHHGNRRRRPDRLGGRGRDD